MTRCPFCGHEFDEASANTACQSCAMSSSSCGMVKCPNCGYELPGEARLLKLMKRIRSAVIHAGGRRTEARVRETDPTAEDAEERN